MGSQRDHEFKITIMKKINVIHHITEWNINEIRKCKNGGKFLAKENVAIKKNHPGSGEILQQIRHLPCKWLTCVGMILKYRAKSALGFAKCDLKSKNKSNDADKKISMI